MEKVDNADNDDVNNNNVSSIQLIRTINNASKQNSDDESSEQLEDKIFALMDALEAKMSELMGDAVHRVTLPRATTPVAPAVKSVRKTTPRPVPATPKATTPYAGAVEDDVDEEPRDASFEFSCVFGEGAWPVKPKGKLSLVVAPEETSSTARCAVEPRAEAGGEGASVHVGIRST